jgi:hypothetical protein
VVHATPAFETDMLLALLSLDVYLGWTFAKLRRRFARYEVDRARASINV